MPVHFFGLQTLCRLNFILKGLYCVSTTCIRTMVIVQKCAAPRGCQSDTEREEEERGGGEESPSGRIQRGRRQHGKGSRNTQNMADCQEKFSGSRLTQHFTVTATQAHKLSLVVAYTALHWNRLFQPCACALFTHRDQMQSDLTLSLKKKQYVRTWTV